MAENNSPIDPLNTPEETKINPPETPSEESIIADLIESVKEEEVASVSQESNTPWIPKEIEIKDVSSLITIIQTKWLDYIRIEPQDEWVEVTYVKDKNESDKILIKYPLYTQILLKIKEISGMSLTETWKVQDWAGNFKSGDKNYKITAKVSPSDFGEKIFFKSIEQAIKKSSGGKVSLWKIFWFLWATLFVSLILMWVFITFVVLNAKTIDDVKFFYSLGINLNNINAFIQQVVTVVFSILLIIETIVSAIILFKFFLTKKVEKKRKTMFLILSILTLIITFSTATLWMIIDKKIKSLPNWQEVAYWNVQVFDNEKLISEKFDKWDALIRDLSNIIGPITLKYDLTLFEKSENDKGLIIEKYLWDFGDGTKAEELNPTTIKSFTEKGTYNVTLMVEARDITGKIIEKKVDDIKTIRIDSIVKVIETTLPNGGKQVEFDASDLKNLGQIEWYFEENPANPVWVWEIFRPSKIFYEEQLIGMKIKNIDSETAGLDKIFTIQGQDSSSSIAWEIFFEQSERRDLEFTFWVKNAINDFGNGFITEFKWTFWEKEVTKKADITKLEESSKTSFTFSDYGSYEIKVTLKDSSWKEKLITKTINITKKLWILEWIKVYNENNKEIEWFRHEKSTREYYLHDLWVPAKIRFDTRLLRTDNPLYTLKEVKWDIGDDGDNDEVGKTLTHEIFSEWNSAIKVTYFFENIRSAKDNITMEERIYIDSKVKDVLLDLQIDMSSEYVPSLVKFDASLSYVRDDNITKFIYDYGDGKVEERDAINLWHLYSEAWDYTVTLTIVTENWKRFSLEKKVILKPKPQTVKISTSMKIAPIGQAIDFNSSESEWQIISYFWDFGDGYTSTDANPSHVYTQKWSYEVLLRVWFINNNFLEDTISIEVTN